MKVREKVIREITVTDARSMSTMEVMGVIREGLAEAQATKAYDRYYKYALLIEDETIEQIAEELVGYYTLRCNPVNKSIELTTESYEISIEPAATKGIYVWYKSLEEWGELDCITFDVDWCIEHLNIDWEE